MTGLGIGVAELAVIAFIVMVMMSFVLAIVRSVRGNPPPGPADPEEAHLLQDFQKQLTRMEQRVEALETILLEGRAGRTPSSPSEPER